MSKKNNIKKLRDSNHRERYKAYKSSKTWIYAAITSFAAIFGGGAAVSDLVHADSVSSYNNKEVDSLNLLVSQSKAKIPAEVRAYSAEARQANQATISIDSTIASGKNKVDFNGYYVYRTYINTSTHKGVEILAQINEAKSVADLYVVNIDMSSGKAVDLEILNPC